MDSWVVLARLTRTRGIKGELCGVSFTDHPERFKTLRSVFLNGAPFELERVWYHKDQPVFKLRGVDSIDDAERLVGLEVTIPVEQRLKLADGEYFYSDLVGCRMVDNASGVPVGEVVGWQEIGSDLAKQSQILLEVDDGKGDPLLIPFARSILTKIDVEAREIRAELPPGLAELNR
jgi:16S rRNA processing protein RimM